MDITQAVIDEILEVSGIDITKSKFPQLVLNAYLGINSPENVAKRKIALAQEYEKLKKITPVSYSNWRYLTPEEFNELDADTHLVEMVNINE